jgi:hypothetical protein
VANVPGNLTAAVRETLFAGGKGYCIWYGPYTDTWQWAELAVVNDVVARHEVESDLFRCFAPEGKGDYFHAWSHDVFASTLETDTGADDQTDTAVRQPGIRIAWSAGRASRRASIHSVHANPCQVKKLQRRFKIRGSGPRGRTSHTSHPLR